MAKDKQWNWQKDDWPFFQYDAKAFMADEFTFVENAGLSFGVVKHISETDQTSLMIDLISDEAYKTSEIEGELLDRASLQSSIKRYFGFKAPLVRNHPLETGIAEMMHDLYTNFDEPLTHTILFEWHKMLMNGRTDLEHIGAYRSHAEPMQIVSGNVINPKVHFEAPPSSVMQAEMGRFIHFFNDSSPEGQNPLSPLIRASIVHIYFESIHPFEDGNGRIGRVLVEKSLAQNLKRPTLIAMSHTIHDEKKKYYDALEKQSKSNEVTPWISYFSKMILKAQAFTLKQIEFLVQKAKFFEAHEGKLNERQKKVIKRMFDEGLQGFKGGLSAHNYMAITKTSASTATRDLHELVEMKILKQTGQKKATRYALPFLKTP